MRKTILTGISRSWRGVLALCLGLPFACLNPMPDDFPNHHDEEVREDNPSAETPPPSAGGTTDGTGAPSLPNESPAPDGDSLEDPGTAPDAGAPPVGDAGVVEDDVSQ